MPSRRIALCTALLLAAGCTSSATHAKGHPTTSIQGMLAFIPRHADTNLVSVNLYQDAATAFRIAVPKAGADQAAYFNALRTKAGVPGSDLSQQLTEVGPKQIGFDADAVTADVSAGTPPNPYLAALGYYDRAAVDKAAHADRAWRGQLSTPTYDRTTIYRWGRDNAVNMRLAHTGPFTDLGQSRRFAFPGGTEFLYARNDQTTHAMLDTATKGADSLADQPDFAAAAKALDARHVYAAALTATPPTVADVATGSPNPALRKRLQAMALAPYRLAGLGISAANGTPTVVIVLVNADAATAKANAGKLAETVRSGTSIATDQPWSTWLTVRTVRTSGNLTIGTFATRNVTLWSSAVRYRDSLLMTR